MVHFVSARAGRRMGRDARSWQAASPLYSRSGERKYLNLAERRRVLAASGRLSPRHALFIATLAWTGARVSEVLALTPASFQIEENIVAIRTLKRRCHCVREIPIPPRLMSALDSSFGIAVAQRDAKAAAHRLFSWSRVTAWRLMRRIAGGAGIVGDRACPRGLRHAFGVATLQAGVPFNLVQRWLGHASPKTTSIYAAAVGPEERMFAARFWRAFESSMEAPDDSIAVLQSQAADER